MLFFVVTFVEQHLYLIPSFFGNPVQDLQVQWKATGTLVGSFNLFVYGSVIYIGERISRDSSYGHSKIAYALFAVGLLNSFTNFAHYTYHLPQDHLVKWISFVVSMAEITVLCRAVYDVWGRGNVVFCCHVRRAAFVSDTEFFRQSRAGSPGAVEGNRYASGKL
jgi:nitric oxide reductase subunit B